MTKILKVLVSVVPVMVLLGTGGFVWAKRASSTVLARTIETHAVDFPIPFPLDSAEMALARVGGVSPDSLALERALERGRHLVESRYACTECHGRDFGGGVMVDDPMLGRILGPNITAGAGGRTAAYTPADWDRIVRHGVLPDGRPALMPSEDFRLMSDEELSDIVAYVRSRSPVNDTVAPVTLGPVGLVLVATGKFTLSADLLESHSLPHEPVPPTAEVSVEFGRHLAGVCMGCHRAELTGGPIPAGDPSWPPATDLTAGGPLGTWTYDEFVAVMREGRRPDGTPLRAPMDMVNGYSSRMSDTELEALWTYLRSLPRSAS